MNPDRFRVLISAVLTIGVAISAVLILVGLVWAAVVGWEGSSPGAPATDLGRADFGGLEAAVRDLRPIALVQVGLLVLIATPVIRVAASVVGFALERDRVYVVITSVVLAILIISLFRLG